LDTTEIVTLVIFATALVAIIVVVLLLRDRITSLAARVSKRGFNLKATAQEPAPELKTKKVKVSENSSVEPLVGTSMDLGDVDVSKNSTIRVRDKGEPFLHGNREAEPDGTGDSGQDL